MRRRTMRGRLWHMGVLLLIYSCINVYSDNKTINNISDNNSKSNIDIVDDKSKPNTDISENKNQENNDLGDKPVTTLETFTSTAAADADVTVTTELQSETTISTHHHHHAVPTWRPLRENCTPPAIEQFPQPLMSPDTRKHGGLVLHVFVAVFTFLGLAIVCDDYFVSSLDRLCEELKLSPDVAGATFMAAGSSAPELATVVIGVFFAKDDIGVSGVIGSAVFNIMFVISVCALCSGTVCQLNWWPLVRDCFFYALSILVMLMIIINHTISWVESLIMLLCYVIYCITLHFNSALEKWAHSLKLPIKLPSKEEQSSLVTYKNLPDTSYTQGQSAAVQDATQHNQQNQQQETNIDQGYNAYDPNASWDPNAAWGENQQPATHLAISAPGAPSTNSWGDGYNSQANPDPLNAWDSSEGQKNYGYNSTGDQPTETKQNVQQVQATQPSSGPPKNPDFYKSKEIKLGDIVNPLDKPTEGGIPAQIAWVIVYPIHYMCRLTMPDCRTERFRNWYPFTFIISMIWISFYSYFMVWMITIIGATLGIPDTVMGLTFVAAGVSVPDALSSIAVIKEGYGDMAVSNAVGSNVFDILICLGLPWFIQTAIIKPGSHVNVISKGLTYSTLSLLSTVVFLLCAVHLNGWKLDKRLGIVLMFWYFLFITVASLYELNVFGELNPPECPSFY